MCDSWKKTVLFSAIFLSSAILLNGLLAHATTDMDKTKSVQGLSNTDGTLTVSTKNVPIWGRRDAPVTIIEFSDFDCPFCTKAYNEILPQLRNDYIDAGKVRFLYRNAPLEIHTNAKLKAVAALCARELKGDNAYYAFHNQLYEQANDTKPVNNLLTSIAKTNGLDVAAFTTCLKGGQKLYDQIDLDLAEAYQVGATGTPTWFIGKTNADGDVIQGIRIVGAQPYSVFRILINQLLQ